MTTLPVPATEWIKTIAEALKKPIELISTPIAEHIAAWLKRKPQLHVHFRPYTCFWCIAKEGQIPVMQLVFSADFSHDEPKEHIVLVNAYVKGAETRYPFDRVIIAPHVLAMDRHLATFVFPVVGKAGHDWRGRLILIDQHERKYNTKKVTFKWVGSVLAN